MKQQLKNGLIAGTVAATLFGAGFMVSAQDNATPENHDMAISAQELDMEMMSFDFYRMGFMDGFESCYMMDDGFYDDEYGYEDEGDWADFEEDFEEDFEYTELEQAPANLNVAFDAFQFHSAEQATAEGYEGTFVTYINADDARFFTVSQESFAPLSDEEVAALEAEMEADIEAMDEDMDEAFMGEFMDEEVPTLEQTLTINGTEVYVMVERVDGVTEAGAFYETDNGVVSVEGELTMSQITSVVEQLLAQ